MFQLLDNLRNVIITTTMEVASCICQANIEALQRQEEERNKREEEKNNKELNKLAEEYLKAMAYHKMYKSYVCWKSISQVNHGLE